MCVFTWSATVLTRENIDDSFVPMPMPLVLSCIQLVYPQTSHLQYQHFLMTYARQSRSACVTTLMVYPHRAEALESAEWIIAPSLRNISRLD